MTKSQPQLKKEKNTSFSSIILVTSPCMEKKTQYVQIGNICMIDIFQIQYFNHIRSILFIVLCISLFRGNMTNNTKTEKSELGGKKVTDYQEIVFKTVNTNISPGSSKIMAG